MILYHGTTKQAAYCIEKEGFLGSELTDLTDGFSHVENGVVFLAANKELALGYGDTVVTVDISDERVKFFQECPVTGLPEYYVSIQDMVDDGAWWIE